MRWIVIVLAIVIMSIAGYAQSSVSLIITLDDISNKKELQDFIDSRAGILNKFTHQYSIEHEIKAINAVSAEVPEWMVEKLEKLPYVQKIERNVIVEMLESTENPESINATQVWRELDSNNLNITGKNITIAVIDSGINYSHPDFGSCSVNDIQTGNCTKIRNGYDFIDNDNNPMDESGHGTKVAGIIGANGSIKGIAPDSVLIAYRVCTDSCSIANILSAMNLAIDPDQDGNYSDAHDIIHLSLGTASQGPDGSWANMVNKAVNEANVTVVLAAGNSGPDGSSLCKGTGNGSFSSVCTPANAGKSLSVGASIGNSDIAGFSSRGPTQYGFIKPEIIAPGVNVNSTSYTGSYDTGNGTSFSSPIISGIVALIKQKHSDWTPDQIRFALRNTAENLNISILEQGYGYSNAYRAVMLNHTQPTGFLNSTERNASGTIILKGVVSALNLTNFTLSWGSGFDPISWNYINSSNETNFSVYWNSNNVSEDGNYTIRLQVFDNETVSEDRLILEIATDKIKPVIQILSPLNNTWLNTTVFNITYNSTDENMKNCSLYWNNELNQTNSTQFNSFQVDSAQGIHNWLIICSDILSNQNSTDIQWINIDNQPPWLNITFPQNNTNINQKIIVNWTAIDNLDDNLTCQLKLNETSFNSYAENNTNKSMEINISDGYYNLFLTCWDNANNTNQSGNVTILIDRYPPEIHVFNPANNSFLNTTEIIFNFSTTDTGIDKCELWANWTGWNLNETFSNISSGIIYTTAKNLTDSIYQWQLLCNSSLGNINTTDNMTFEVDRIPPQLMLTSPVNNTIWTSSNSVDFRYNFSDYGICYIYINNNNILNKTSGNSFSRSLSNGIYNWSVLCQDKAGNVNRTDIRFFTISYTEPTVQVQSGGGGGGVVLKSVLPSNTIHIPYIDKNQEKTISFDSGTEISIEVDQRTEQVKIILNEKINRTNRLSGLLYKYLEINTTNLDSLNYAVIMFAVEKNWSRDKENIRMLHYKNEKWNKLETKLVGSDNVHEFYNATTDSFSLFAIVGDIKPFCGNEIPERGEECDGEINKTCVDFGFDNGNLICLDCRINTQGCVATTTTTTISKAEATKTGNESSEDYTVLVFIILSIAVLFFLCTGLIKSKTMFKKTKRRVKKNHGIMDETQFHINIQSHIFPTLCFNIFPYS